MENILHFDFNAFYNINRVWANPFFDVVMPYFRNPYFWAPVYFFLFIWISTQFNTQKALLWCVMFLLCVSACDALSSHVIKQTIYRMRPCYDPFWAGKMVLRINHCSSSSSFTSSHATNHFGMAWFGFITLRHLHQKISLLFFVWAFLVCWAQVYVGVHYPLDVVCGGLVGSLIGYNFARLFQQLSLASQFQKNNL